MKFLLCLVLCLAAAEAKHVKHITTKTYSSGVVPATPVAYAAGVVAPAPVVHSTIGVVAAAPVVHGTIGLGFGGGFAGAAVVAAPSVQTTTVVKKEVTLG